MASASVVQQLTTKDTFDKTKPIKMEEQTVPSAGFSPQSNPFDSIDYIPKFNVQATNNNYGQFQQQQQQQQQNQQQQQQQQQQPQTVEGLGLGTYGNLADTFDLSLLGDPCYDDGGLSDGAYDLATVPSPSSWSLSSGSGYEGNSWNHTMSLYAASPTGGNPLDMVAFSPDSKPCFQAPSPISYSSDSNYQSYPASPVSVPVNNNHSNNGTNSLVKIKIENVTEELGSSGGGGCHEQQQQHQQQLNLNQQNLLLRQCLADTSFQKKYNFKPLELPPASLSSLLLMDEPSMVSNAIHELGTSVTSNSSNNPPELNGIEPVFSMAFEHIRSDIHNACATLAISPDPLAWSASDVQSWLTHVLSGPISSMNPILMMTSGGDDQPPHPQQQQAATAHALRQFWNMDGRTLCSLSEEEFRLRDAVSGDGIFYNLDLWKMLQFQNQNQNQHQNLNQNITIKTENSSNQRGPANPAIVVSRPSSRLGPEVLSSSSNNGGSNNNNFVDFDELFLTPTTISSLMNPSNSAAEISSSSQGGGKKEDMSGNNNSVISDRFATPPFETTAQHQQQGFNSAQPSPSLGGSEPMNTDDDDEDEDEDLEDDEGDSSEAAAGPSMTAEKAKAPGKNKKSKASPGNSSGTPNSTATPTKSGAHIHLWQFLKELLSAPQQHGSCIRWLDQSRGVFKIEDSVRVARLWGLRKNRPAMNYDKLSRSIRQYYRKGIMRKTERSQRLVYQFCHPYGL